MFPDLVIWNEIMHTKLASSLIHFVASMQLLANYLHAKKKKKKMMKNPVGMYSSSKFIGH